MGRRKIEIKAIKDDRNRSVTFLKRKGGLFKKAHELSVLCSVDVAVIIFGNNKKLYEYSSADMRDLITRQQYHGGPSEHKGPGDFTGDKDDEDDEDGDVTPPAGMDPMDHQPQHQMMPPQYHNQQPPFPHVRNPAPSASPPVHSVSAFPGSHIQRGHTPQSQLGSRPSSRNEPRRSTPNMMPPQAPHSSMAYMPGGQPMYNPNNLMPQPSPPYPYSTQQQSQSQPQPPQPPYMDDRRPAPMPAYPSPRAPSANLAEQRAPPIPHHPTPPPQGANQIPRISPPLQRPHEHLQQPTMTESKLEAKSDAAMRPQPPLLNTDTAIKKARKVHSIFTPVEENRSFLSQHLASFAREPPPPKKEPDNAVTSAPRSSSTELGSYGKPNGRSSRESEHQPRTSSVPPTAEAAFAPPSRSNSLQAAVPGATRLRGPRLTVQIPEGGSENESGGPRSSNSPRPIEALTPSQGGRVLLPPPSPSASALLSAGASGPPNPFARPPPQQSISGSGETPVSALPSRFLNNELLPSPSSFYQDWGFNRNGDSNTLPSPLNFATPVVGSGPSFLRDDPHSGPTSSGGPNIPPLKRKSMDHLDASVEEPKRVKISP